MHVIKQKLKSFAAAHRLINGYQGKCCNLHGHNYQVFVTLQAEQLTEQGMVIDFSEIKNMLDPWVQQHWDHAVIVNANDQSLINFLETENQKHFILPNQQNSTVEVLAEYLFKVFASIIDQELTLSQKLKIIELEISETEHSSGFYHE